MFVVQTNKRAATNESLEWLHGSPEDAAAKVEQNLSHYLGYQTKAGATHGAWLVKAGSAIINSKDTGVYTLHVHRSIWDKRVHPSYRSVSTGSLYNDGLTLAELAADHALRPGRGQGLLDYQPDLSLFRDVSPKDLHQGAVGDCGLVGALAAYAGAHPDRLRGLCKQQRLSPDGRYDITLFHPTRNEWVTCSVDDRLPVTPDGSIKFLHASPDLEIWPCLFEKAIAKLFGGYQQLKATPPLLGLKCLTGKTQDELLLFGWQDTVRDELEAEGGWECRHYKFSSPNKSERVAHTDVSKEPWPDDLTTGGRSSGHLFRLLSQLFEQGCLIVAADGGKDAKSAADLIKPNGIVKNHAYSIIQVQCDVACSGFDLVQLRNTWGEQEWNGAWSDGDSMWQRYPNVYKQLCLDVEDDGLFWMSKEDFANEFRVVYCCLSDSAVEERSKKRRLKQQIATAAAAQFLVENDKMTATNESLEWLDGSPEDAATKVEQNLSRYLGYMTKSGVTHGAYLIKAGSKIVDSQDTGGWTLHVHKSVVQAASASTDSGSDSDSNDDDSDSDSDDSDNDSDSDSDNDSDISG